MIGSLRGTLLDRGDGEILVEVAGVGYRIAVAPATTIAVGEIGDDVFVHVHHHIREDAQTLFGFTSREERATFQTLVGTHGVGPALALAVLATHPPTALVDVVANNDVAALTLVPGVGRKTAERLLVELRNRLAVPVLDDGDAGAGGSSGSSVAAVREALAGLGYGTDEIRDVLRDLPGDGDSAALLRDALKSLGAKRA